MATLTTDALRLNENTAKAWFATLLDKEILPDECHDEDFANHYLDSRDSAPCDTNWMTAFDFINAALHELNTQHKEKISRLQAHYRKIFFDKIIRKFHHSDLAAYVSEDMELIAGFILTGQSNDFIQNLMASYEKGELPDR